jgi:potassium/chloride transporter 4/5/6
VPKNISMYPKPKEEVEGTIDVWWIVNDGGMLILLAFLLQQDKIWKKCKLRVFIIAEVFFIYFWLQC